MTCQEFHCHLEISTDSQVQARNFSDDAVAHVNMCAGCKALIDQRVELTANLRRVRDSLPEIAAYLDAAVVAGFRNQITTPTTSRFHMRRRSLATIGYSAVLAAAVVIGLLLLPVRKPTSPIAPHPTRAVSVGESPKATIKGALQQQIAKRSVGLRAHYDKRVPRSASGVDNNSPLISGFTGLIYCDQLSCGGEMQMLRLQVPRSTLGLPSAPNHTGGTVFADVLVGPDGIARGIRIDQ